MAGDDDDESYDQSQSADGYVPSAACQAHAPFKCPKGEYCTDWDDGCNRCECAWDDDDLFEFVKCEEEYCSCYRDDSCVPVCTSNDNCVAKSPSSFGKAGLWVFVVFLAVSVCLCRSFQRSFLRRKQLKHMNQHLVSDTTTEDSSGERVQRHR